MKISGDCWSNRYEHKDWSNIMCILKDDPWNFAVNKYVVPDNIPKGGFEGKVVRIPTEKQIYLIQGDRKYAFQNAQQFMGKGYDFEKVEMINEIALNLFPEGSWSEIE